MPVDACPGPIYPSRARKKTSAEHPTPDLADSAGEYLPLPGAGAAAPASSPEYVDLGLYLTGALAEDAMRAAEEHVFGCPSCREHLYRLRDLKGLLEDRALWNRAPRANAERECLDAAETLLALEDRAPARATQHLARCVACRADISAVLESAAEYAAGTLEALPRTTTVELKKLLAVSETGGLAPTTRAQAAGDLLAPIVLPPVAVAPVATGPAATPTSGTYAEIDAALSTTDRARREGRKATSSRRVLSPRVAKRATSSISKRTTSSSKRVTSAATALEASNRRAATRPVAYAGVFGFSAAAAAAVIVAVLASANSVEPTTPSRSDLIARRPDAGASLPLAPRRAPTATSSTAPTRPPVARDQGERDSLPRPPVSDERPNPRSLEAPGDEPVGEPPEAATGPAPAGPDAQAPATSEPRDGAAPTTVAGGPQAASAAGNPTDGRLRSEPRDPSPLDAAPEDDGATVELELAQLAGSAAVRPRGDEKWSNLTRRDGRLALRSGDRIRTSGGAFLSLAQGAYELSVAPRSEIVVRGAKDGPVLGLTEGRLLCEVESFPESRSLTVATHSGQVTAGDSASGARTTGVIFAMVADDRRTVCSVERGSVACRGARGPARSLAAGTSCAVARGGAASEPTAVAAFDDGWARGLRPQRQPIYEARFDRGDLCGFSGETQDTLTLKRPGAALLFAPLDGNRYWGLSARAPKGKVRPLRASPDTRVEVTFWLERESKVVFQLVNERQSKNYKRDLGSQPAGSWQTETFSIMDLDTYFDPGQSPVREGDMFSEIEVLAGNPGDRWKALLGNLVVYRKLYR